MYQQQQPHLNGGYYGPSIPPPKPYRHSSGGRGCCTRCGCYLLDCIFDCGCCLIGFVCKIICSILLFAAFIVVILWLLLRPHTLKLYASDASLSTFNYTSNQLSYNLALNFTLRNPNSHVGVYYDSFEANAIYQGQRFAMAEIDPLYQGSKNTTVIGPVVLKGSNAISLGSDQTSEYQKQRNNGEFKIALKLRLKLRLKLGWFKTGKMKLKYRCDLEVPVNGWSKFKSSKCYFDP